VRRRWPPGRRQLHPRGRCHGRSRAGTV